MFQVHSLGKGYCLFAVQHLQIHIAVEEQDSHQALALLWEVTESWTFLPDSCQTGPVKNREAAFLCASCSLSVVVWFQHPLPSPHVQCGAAAAPGQGQSLPLHLDSVFFHLHADSPFTNKLTHYSTHQS